MKAHNFLKRDKQLNWDILSDNRFFSGLIYIGKTSMEPLSEGP